MPPISAWWARLAVKNSSRPLVRIVNRRDHRHVGQVRTAAVRIVGHEHVARADRRDCRPGSRRTVSLIAPRCTGMCGALTTRSPVGGEDGATEVEPLLDVHAAGRVAQRDPHLLGDAGKLVVEDLQHDRIGLRVSAHVGAVAVPAHRSRQQQLAVGQHLGRPAGIDHRGATRLADDRRAGDEVARLPAARGRRRATSMRPCRRTRRSSRRSRASASRRSASRPAGSSSVERPDDLHAGGHDLQRPAFVDVAVELLVLVGVGLGAGLAAVGAGRDGQTGVEPLVAKVERAAHVDPLGRDAFVEHFVAGLARPAARNVGSSPATACFAVRPIDARRAVPRRRRPCRSRRR